MTIQVLNGKGHSNRAIAKTLGVSEGAVRYHRKRQTAVSNDGRSQKPFLIEECGLEKAVCAWWETEQAGLSADGSPNLSELYDHLVGEHHYTGSFKSVQRYVRARFPRPKRRTYRRFETPPGAQSQSDWADRSVDIGDLDGPTKLHAFVMILSHSRRAVVIWSRSMEQLSWHRCHNEAFRRLGGVAAVNRIDNLKTGVAKGAGAQATINERYQTYARMMRFHVDPHEVRTPRHKGKVERRVQVLDHLGLSRRTFSSLEELQAWTDQALEAKDKNRLCPPTGKTVWDTWQDEIPFLGALPEELPEPFDLVKDCKVHDDCTIRFEGRTYGVPFSFVGQTVEVHGTATLVQIFDRIKGDLLISYPRRTPERILLDESCYKGEATDRVLPPQPLGRMARRLLEVAALPVERRPVDLYAALAEVAR